MITGEDIERCKAEKQGLKLVVIDTQQFFEIEIPVSMNEKEYINSAECRQKCAAMLLDQTTDLVIDRVCDDYDSVNEMWLDPVYQK